MIDLLAKSSPTGTPTSRGTEPSAFDFGQRDLTSISHSSLSHIETLARKLEERNSSRRIDLSAETLRNTSNSPTELRSNCIQLHTNTETLTLQKTAPGEFWLMVTNGPNMGWFKYTESDGIRSLATIKETSDFASTLLERTIFQLTGQIENLQEQNKDPAPRASEPPTISSLPNGQALNLADFSMRKLPVDWKES